MSVGWVGGWVGSMISLSLSLSFYMHILYIYIYINNTDMYHRCTPGKVHTCMALTPLHRRSAVCLQASPDTFE